jgi:hypothetical protein
LFFLTSAKILLTKSTPYFSITTVTIIKINQKRWMKSTNGRSSYWWVQVNK